MTLRPLRHLAAAAGCIALGVTGKLIAPIVIGAGLFALLVAAALTVLPGARGWALVRTVDPQRPSIGESVSVNVRATPISRLAGQLGLRESVGSTLTTATLVPSRSRSPVDVEWTYETTERGRFTVGPATLWRSDRLGFFRRRCGEVAAASIVVRTRTVPVDGLRVAGWATDTAHPNAERSDERGDLRPYVAGDDPRRINWKATARSAGPQTSLIVSDREPQRHDDTVAVVVDLAELPPGAMRELALIAAASAWTKLADRHESVLEIRTGVTLHRRCPDLDDGLDALALVEETETLVSDGPASDHGLVIAGSSSLAGSTTIVCSANSGTDESSVGRRGLVVRSIDDLARLFGESSRGPTP